jgi:hypothetical protein
MVRMALMVILVGTTLGTRTFISTVETGAREDTWRSVRSVSGRSGWRVCFRLTTAAVGD